ncbi:MAG: polyprenyl synthetase family protein [Thermoanaerobaculia bacterium]
MSAATAGPQAGGGFPGYLDGVRPAIDAELSRLLPPAATAPGRLHAAMRYSVLAGGKRLRPALVLLAGRSFGATPELLLPGAAAIEMIHTYSLIHDDLPALDNDDLRRGRPTAHREFDEATAILAGDALLTLGLTVLAQSPEALAGEVRARAVALVGTAIGTGGMIGGQVEDLAVEKAWPEPPAAAEAALERIHRGKTGALIAASLRLGGVYAAVSAAEDLILRDLGELVGLLFQVRDDILDVEGSASSLGKTPGKDAAASKLTYPALFGLERSRERLKELGEEASDRIAALPRLEREIWMSLISFLGHRGH